MQSGNDEREDKLLGCMMSYEMRGQKAVSFERLAKGMLNTLICLDAMECVPSLYCFTFL
jgi:hypothetical protein